MIKKLLPFIMASVVCNCCPLGIEGAEVNEPSKFTHTQSPTGFIKGINWGWTGSRGQYLGPAPADSMKKLAETGANWVCISFAGNMDKPNEPHIVWGDKEPNMVTDDEIRLAIDLARKNNLRIILKPTVNVRDGTWRGEIGFKTPDGKRDTEAWDKWWADFRQFLIYYAKIAQETKCEMLCLGCEMGSTEPFASKWRSTITDVRKVYTGPITYNANHGNEEKVSWWDAVDIIGMSGYFPVGTDNLNQEIQQDLSKVPPSDSSLENIKKRWVLIEKKLKYVSRKFDRPLFFIEIGVCSARGFSAGPWTHPQKDAAYDADEQARFYQAVIESFWDEPWFFGFVWWEWPPALYTLEEAKTDTGFCIYGKPAEKIVKDWFSKNRQ